jgi:hypothetical protein
MNAVEKLEAAIGKLETLAQHASPAAMFLPIQDEPVEYDLGTTLYRTIDAQLAILHGALESAEDSPRGWPQFSGDKRDLDLALAILGESE